MATTGISVAAKLKRIRAAYLKQLPEQQEAIRTALKAYGLKPGYEELELLHRGIHNLKGATASFGFGKLSAAAAGAEKMAKEALQTGEKPDRKWMFQFEEYLDEMKRETADLESSQAMDLQALDLVAAAESSESREHKVVYLCEDDSFQRMSLATQIGCFGFQVMAFGDLDQLYQAVKNSPPDVIVTGLTFPGNQLGGADMVAKIHAELEKPIPAVFISSENDFSYRLAAVRAGSSAYFVKPVDITDLCSKLTALTTVEKPEPYRILIVDDDPHLSQMYAAILQGAEMVTRELNNPLLAMSHLFEFKPDLIMTDMHMPGCNGMELARTIRQLGQAFSIPIVFLSSETDTEMQFDARRSGDEFLSKPIKPEHLIAAVTVRAERMKIIRSFMIRDSMTGLFNHSATMERLETAVAEAGLRKKEACLAMIDVDRFRQVNDSYGHPTGDRLLVTLAHLLRQRLRPGDIVGRYGGGQFAVILPESDLAAAVSLVDGLRESFAAIQFPAGDASFTATFSGGIAPLSRFGNSDRLCQGADQALVQAKEGGRNRVVAAAEEKR